MWAEMLFVCFSPFLFNCCYVVILLYYHVFLCLYKRKSENQHNIFKKKHTQQHGTNLGGGGMVKQSLEQECKCVDERLESGSSEWWLTPVSNSSKWQRERIWRPDRPGEDERERETNGHFLKIVLSYAFNVICWSTDFLSLTPKAPSPPCFYFFLPVSPYHTNI